eukprot:scaffold4007_cov362-Prasinococcus_capsulatus_cf.AAC.3
MSIARRMLTSAWVQGQATQANKNVDTGTTATCHHVCCCNNHCIGTPWSVDVLSDILQIPAASDRPHSSVSLCAITQGGLFRKRTPAA